MVANWKNKLESNGNGVCKKRFSTTNEISGRKEVLRRKIGKIKIIFIFLIY